MSNRINIGDIVKHFKHEFCADKSWYIYKILGFAEHTETKEKLVIYQALYKADELGVNYGIYCRPYDMFMSEVDHIKYPQYTQKYRFEVIETDKQELAVSKNDIDFIEDCFAYYCANEEQFVSYDESIQTRIKTQTIISRLYSSYSQFNCIKDEQLG